MMSNDAKRLTRARSSTRDRILDSALDLFNGRGPDRVTTAEIAEAVKINEGNLYYHFRTKESLVLALFARFEADAVALVASVNRADEGRRKPMPVSCGNGSRWCGTTAFCFVTWSVCLRLRRGWWSR